MSAVTQLTSDGKIPVVLPPLKYIGGPLSNIIQMIKDKNIVALHAGETWRIFHNLPTVNLDERRVVFIDCSSCEWVLGDGKWSYNIEHEIKKVKELDVGELKDRIIKMVDVPHKEFIGVCFPGMPS